jgi:hypothetical protein
MNTQVAAVRQQLPGRTAAVTCWRELPDKFHGRTTVTDASQKKRRQASH